MQSVAGINVFIIWIINLFGTQNNRKNGVGWIILVRIKTMKQRKFLLSILCLTEISLQFQEVMNIFPP